jgi:DNA polymerase-3 subunit chi
MATEVEFHTGVAEPLAFAARLLRKAYRVGARVLVTAPADTIGPLDRLLWTAEERDFLPHARWPGASAAVLARSPIWLLGSAAEAPTTPPPVLLNLGAGAPADLSAFTRIIEIVGAEPDSADAGRQRWRQYKARGLHVVHHGGG